MSSAIKTSRPFWEVSMGGGVTFPPAVCRAMIEEVMQAMQRALSSGVVEYRVGSRSLRRFTLKELMELLAFWQMQLQVSQGLSARRAVPTDY
jgi:hypothetical protein